MRIFHSLLILTLACGVERPSNVASTNPINYQLVGGPCEGCEAILEYGARTLNSVDTLRDFLSSTPGLLLYGTVYVNGTKKPAEGIILYIHHTNQDGIYPTHGEEEGWGKRHGYLRGWVKTDAQGNYSFYTQIPGAYPTRTNPKHIHLTILEPDGKYYYIEDYLFEGDSLLTKGMINKTKPRGGIGFLLNPIERDNVLVASRDIYLGKNVPGYGE